MSIDVGDNAAIGVQERKQNPDPWYWDLETDRSYVGQLRHYSVGVRSAGLGSDGPGIKAFLHLYDLVILGMALGLLTSSSP